MSDHRSGHRSHGDFFSLVSEESSLERAVAMQERLEKAHRLIVNLQRSIGRELSARDRKIEDLASHLEAAQALNAALMRMHRELVEYRDPLRQEQDGGATACEGPAPSGAT